MLFIIYYYFYIFSRENNLCKYNLTDLKKITVYFKKIINFFNVKF